MAYPADRAHVGTDNTKANRKAGRQDHLNSLHEAPQQPLRSRRNRLQRLMDSEKKSKKVIAIAVLVSGIAFVCTICFLVVTLLSNKEESSQTSLDLTPSPAQQIGTSRTTFPSAAPISTTIPPLVSQYLDNITDLTTSDLVQTESPSQSIVMTTSRPSPADTLPAPTRDPITAVPVPVPVVVRPPSSPTTTTFYTIGDIPYSRDQSVILEEQMKNLPADAEFLVHVGDLRYAAIGLTCRRAEYEDAARLLNYSHAPVFVIKGDNDWTDCPNPADGLRYWHDNFEGFEGKYWNHNFDIRRQEDRPDNFAFVHKGTLFMGLNIVGGDRPSASYIEWTERLSSEVDWVIEMITEYVEEQGDAIGRIVMFGHANPNHLHNDFFTPLRRFIRDSLDNSIPMLYLNGDKHEWSYDPNFYDQESFLRMMVSGKGVEPPLRVEVTADGTYTDPVDAFQYDRMIDT